MLPPSGTVEVFAKSPQVRLGKIHFPVPSVQWQCSVSCWFLSLGQAGVKSSWKLAATSQGWAKRASQQFRNTIERRCKEIVDLKLQHFRDHIETRWVNLSKFGPWPPGAEAAAVSQPLQLAASLKLQQSFSGTFWTSQLSKVLRTWGVSNFFTCKCLIWPHGSAPAALASLLFDPSEPQIIGKTQWIACYLFARLHLLSSHSFTPLIFSLLLFSSPLWLVPPLLFHLSIWSEVWLLNFLRLL